MCSPRFSYQDSVAVIHLMLNNLCRKAGELVFLLAKFGSSLFDMGRRKGTNVPYVHTVFYQWTNYGIWMLRFSLPHPR